MIDVNTLIKEGGPYDFLFFWGHTEKFGMVTKACLSQWYPSQFVEDGVTYNCAEQYMMAAKAKLMGDIAIWQQILLSSDPKIIKSLGRKVRNFDPMLWNKHKAEVVVKGNILKFSQNSELRQFLDSTGNKVLVEASPYDTIWGIGLSEKEAEAKNPRTWRGSNLLGFSLMEVRDILRTE